MPRQLNPPAHGALSVRRRNLGINRPSLPHVEKYPVGIDISPLCLYKQSSGSSVGVDWITGNGKKEYQLRSNCNISKTTANIK